MKRNWIFGWVAAASFVFGCGETAAQEPSQQLPQDRVRLRFDELQRDTLAETSSATAASSQPAVAWPFAYKLNRRRVTGGEAYEQVTLWNVRRVRVKNRRMRLADTMRRERVQLLKFFVERDRRKGVRPHLQGNVAGYTWSASSLDGSRRRKLPVHIRTYTLRAEYDSLRRAGGIDRSGKVPDALWHPLSPDARYVLDGIEVPGRVFQFLDGLILRSLDIFTDSSKTNDGRPLVAGRIYTDRVPLIQLNGASSSVGEWLWMCRSNAFSLEAEVPMYYYYMLPVEAVETFGACGKFGAVCIRSAR